MKSLFTYLLLVLTAPILAQVSWQNIPLENQAEEASANGNHNLAIELYQEALDFRKAKYPDGFYHTVDALREVSKALDNLQGEHSRAGNHRKNIELCEELVSWSEEGIKLFPSTPWPYLEYGLAKIQMAESYQSLAQYDQGTKICFDLIEYIQQTDHNPHYEIVSNQIIPFAHARAGEILKDQERLKASAGQHQLSMAAWQKALEYKEETLYHEEIAEQAEICVQRFHKLKDSVNVVKYAEIALHHYEILREIDPDNEEFTREVISAGNALANYKSGWGLYEEAIQYYLKSLAIYEKKSGDEENPDDLTQVAALHLQLSRWYESLNNEAKSSEHLIARIKHLKQLQELIPDTDYSYSISRNQYDVAKKIEVLTGPAEALIFLNESVSFGQKSLEGDPNNATLKQWQWILEFYRYQLLKDLKDYDLAHGSLDRLRSTFITLEDQEPGIQYSEHINEVVVSQRELAYPEVIKLDAEVEVMEEGTMKFNKYLTLVKTLRKLSKKDTSMQLPYIKHASGLGWSGLLAGKFKESSKVLKKAMKIKPIDPYLVTNYAPSLLLQGKYKKAEKIYAKYYNEPFKPGKKIIYGFIEDLEHFDEEGVIPKEYRAQVEEIKVKLNEWNTN